MKKLIAFISIVFFVDTLDAAHTIKNPSEQLLDSLTVYEQGSKGNLVGCGFCQMVKRPAVSKAGAYCQQQHTITKRMRDVVQGHAAVDEKITALRALLREMQVIREKHAKVNDLFFDHFRSTIENILQQWPSLVVEKQLAAFERSIQVFEGEECVVCYSAQATVIFSPCGHLLTCSSCHPKDPQVKCYTCKQEATGYHELNGDIHTCKTQDCKNAAAFYCPQCLETKSCEACHQPINSCDRCQQRLKRMFRPNLEL